MIRSMQMSLSKVVLNLDILYRGNSPAKGNRGGVSLMASSLPHNTAQLSERLIVCATPYSLDCSGSGKIGPTILPGVKSHDLYNF